MAFKRFKQQQQQTKSAHLNITSLMDIFVIILVFLLYNVSFEILHLSTVNASVPTISDDKTIIDVDKKSVNMTMQLQPNGIKLSGGNEWLDEASMNKLNKFFPLKKGKQDFASLSIFLVGIKQQYPRSHSLVIIPDDDMPYETVVAAMDASRETMAKSATEAKPLFPDVVISRTVK